MGTLEGAHHIIETTVIAIDQHSRLVCFGND